MDYHGDMQREQAHTGRAVSGFPVGLGNSDYKQAPYKGRTVPLTVTNQSQLIFPADAQRSHIYVVNNDALGSISMSVGQPMAYGQGYRAAAGGGGFLLDASVPTEALYFIGNIASNANISVTVF